MIHHKTARRIASEWHGGQWTGLYALASSGAITALKYGNEPGPGESMIDAVREIVGDSVYPTARHKRDYDDLYNLLVYVRHYGPRGPVAGWGRMPW